MKGTANKNKKKEARASLQIWFTGARILPAKRAFKRFEKLYSPDKEIPRSVLVLEALAIASDTLAKENEKA